MKNKKRNIILFLIGILFMLSTVFLKEYLPRTVYGILIGLGAGLFGVTASNLYMIHYNRCHPQASRQADIDFYDERSTMIRNRAKAMSADIIQWFIIGIAAISIIIDAPLWVTLVIVGVFLLKNMIELWLMNKYSKEM